MEEEARRQRRALMGGVLPVLINGGDTVQHVEPSCCPVCAMASNSATVRQALSYFRHNPARMDYPTYRHDGYPIGSGTVKNGANTLVHHRLRHSGHGWIHDAANAMLAGLNGLQSDRFPPI